MFLLVYVYVRVILGVGFLAFSLFVWLLVFLVLSVECLIRSYEMSILFDSHPLAIPT